MNARPYFEAHVPSHADDPAFTSLRGLNDVVAITLIGAERDETYHLWFDDSALQQGTPPEGQSARTTFRLDHATFAKVVAGELAPQTAFFTLKLGISGDVLFGLQIGTLLAGFFKRHPWRAEEPARA